MVSPEFADRPLKKLCLFDVDGTLTLARQVRSFFFFASIAFGLTFLRQRVSPEMIEVLRALRKKVIVAFVGGSDLVKISEQLLVEGNATGNN